MLPMATLHSQTMASFWLELVDESVNFVAFLVPVIPTSVTSLTSMKWTSQHQIVILSLPYAIVQELFKLGAYVTFAAMNKESIPAAYQMKLGQLSMWMLDSTLAATIVSSEVLIIFISLKDLSQSFIITLAMHAKKWSETTESVPGDNIIKAISNYN